MVFLIKNIEAMQDPKKHHTRSLNSRRIQLQSRRIDLMTWVSYYDACTISSTLLFTCKPCPCEGINLKKNNCNWDFSCFSTSVLSFLLFEVFRFFLLFGAYFICCKKSLIVWWESSFILNGQWHKLLEKKNSEFLHQESNPGSRLR